ncbi:hypothetical protein H1C71_015494, partial [Ictidomys tridecemlineatus]
PHSSGRDHSCNPGWPWPGPRDSPVPDRPGRRRALVRTPGRSRLGGHSARSRTPRGWLTHDRRALPQRLRRFCGSGSPRPGFESALSPPFPAGLGVLLNTEDSRVRAQSPLRLDTMTRARGFTSGSPLGPDWGGGVARLHGKLERT